uniref:Uncharacterized protein n=1 Tax=Anguilla anguilla TaxID=7936 RepID=A0A0E9WSQ1_ANGAN
MGVYSRSKQVMCINQEISQLWPETFSFCQTLRCIFQDYDKKACSQRFEMFIVGCVPLKVVHQLIL